MYGGALVLLSQETVAANVSQPSLMRLCAYLDVHIRGLMLVTSSCLNAAAMLLDHARYISPWRVKGTA